MTKLEEVVKILGAFRDEPYITITAEEAHQITGIVKELFESRMRWIESAMEWHDAARCGGQEPAPAATLEESARKLAFEFLSDTFSGKKAMPDLSEDLATRVQTFGSGRVREAGRFWGFHLGFLRTAIEAGRNKEEILNRIDDLHEAMTGHRREP